MRTEGVVGNAVTDLEWRWTPTAEERLLARGDEESKPLAPPEGAAASAAEPPVVPTPTAASPKPAAVSPPVPAGATAAATPRATAEPSARRGITRPAGEKRTSCSASRLAWLSRTSARRRRSRCANRDRLVGFASGRDVAPADWTGLVVVCGRWRSDLHARAAWRGRDRLVLPRVDRRAGVAASRPGSLL